MIDPEHAIANLLAGDAVANSANLEIAALRARLGLGQLVGENPVFLEAIKQVTSLAKY